MSFFAGPQWRINHGADEARARSPPPGPRGPRAETYFFRQRDLVEMVQFVAFPKGMGSTTPSNQATLLCVERVIIYFLASLHSSIMILTRQRGMMIQWTIAKLNLNDVIEVFAELTNAFEWQWMTCGMSRISDDTRRSNNALLLPDPIWSDYQAPCRTSHQYSPSRAIRWYVRCFSNWLVTSDGRSTR